MGDSGITVITLRTFQEGSLPSDKIQCVQGVQCGYRQGSLLPHQGVKLWPPMSQELIPTTMITRMSPVFQFVLFDIFKSIHVCHLT